MFKVKSYFQVGQRLNAFICILGILQRIKVYTPKLILKVLKDKLKTSELESVRLHVAVDIYFSLLLLLQENLYFKI